MWHELIASDVTAANFALQLADSWKMAPDARSRIIVMRARRICESSGVVTLREIPWLLFLKCFADFSDSPCPSRAHEINSGPARRFMCSTTNAESTAASLDVTTFPEHKSASARGIFSTDSPFKRR